MFHHLVTNQSDDSVKILNILKSLHTNLEESKKNNLKYKEKLCNLVQAENSSISNYVTTTQYNQQYQEIQKDFLDKKHSLETVYRSELEQVENELKSIQQKIQQEQNELNSQYNDLQIISDAEINERKLNKDKEFLALNKQFQCDNHTEEVLKNELRNIRQQYLEYKNVMQQKISKLELQLEERIANENKLNTTLNNDISRQVPDTTTTPDDEEDDNVVINHQPIQIINEEQINNNSSRRSIPIYRGKYRKRSYNNVNKINNNESLPINNESDADKVSKQDEPSTPINKKKKIRKLFDPTDTSYFK